MSNKSLICCAVLCCVLYFLFCVVYCRHVRAKGESERVGESERMGEGGRE